MRGWAGGTATGATAHALGLDLFELGELVGIEDLLHLVFGLFLELHHFFASFFAGAVFEELALLLALVGEDGADFFFLIAGEFELLFEHVHLAVEHFFRVAAWASGGLREGDGRENGHRRGEEEMVECASHGLIVGQECKGGVWILGE